MNNFTLLTQEQIEQMTYDECKTHLKRLNKTYPLDTPIAKLSKAHWDLCDDIANTLLWLEDRIQRFEDPRITSMDPNGPAIKPIVVKPAPRAAKEKQPSRAQTRLAQTRFRAVDRVYDNIYVAARQTGVKLKTLKAYVSRKPDRYGFVD